MQAQKGRDLAGVREDLQQLLLGDRHLIFSRQ
ncbi:conserved hypothetical protein [Pseudomonas protegens Pf-5]|uniref:Uncharacterized protein n=1 Tax=Pseudomonas fluorescens (strain ATCC BAA-477 / NRRL B-23932 / Pf-5) TaxID=220664 RepID=Q4KA34_PSEF5|nr:conserved hypothetical protein [Pseudomonas protegens Pf-5]